MADNKPQAPLAAETQPAVETAPSTTAEAPAAPAPVPAADEKPVPVSTGTSAPAAEPTPAPEAAAAAAAAVPAAAAPKVEEPTSASAPAVEAKKDEAAEPAPAEVAAPKASPIQQLWAAAKAHSHSEIWGVTLADPESHVPSQIVFQKYLNANDGDVPKAVDQLTKTLTWRAQAKPLELVTKAFSKDKFAGLGYVTSYGDAADQQKREVFTWNIYGAAAKRMSETFGNLDEFIEWRVALQELGIQTLNIGAATKPITATEDPYKIYQVHDYQSISFLRQSAEVKAASTKTIAVLAQNYPELLKEKFFVNVPAIMGFMYGFMKLFVATKTAKKFHPMTYGSGLAKEFADASVEGLGEKLPQAYGGKGGDLATEGKTTELA
ncbi:Phosphatidylinositol transfer protein SFH5 like [Verticillium longisporum]|uniref:Phosphatidylinositol transfer protein SFH5 n=1 Tax=Verticillium longisporum TaxID=100787 RepID=A0A8I2Z7H2_VERLO|nr:Phosphatidylinositol transfer protein SFH5 like [Verticillium longisporum]RBQ67688.1 hypothetical protein VDGD_05351 [Verticillium dahliae]